MDLLDFAGAMAGKAVDIWSARQASEDERSWNERAYRNRYQWQMEDMRKAGLNPLLAFQQSPGSGPSTSAYDTPSMAGNISSAVQARRVSQELKLLQEQTRERAAEADISEYEKGIIANELWKSNSETSNLIKLYSDDKTNKNWLLDSMREELKGSISSARQTMAAEPEAIANEKFWKSMAGDPAKWMQILRSVLPAVRMAPPPSSARQFSMPYLRSKRK